MKRLSSFRHLVISPLRRIGLVGHLLLTPVYIALIFMFLYYATALVWEMRAVNWDQRIAEMCIAEGGVTIYEAVTLTPEEFRSYGPTQGTIRIPSEQASERSNLPYFRKFSLTYLNESQPRISKLDYLVIRKSDQQVMARSISFGRVSEMSWLGLPYPGKSGCDGIDLDISPKLFIVSGA